MQGLREVILHSTPTPGMGLENRDRTVHPASPKSSDALEIISIRIIILIVVSISYGKQVGACVRPAEL